MFYRKSGKFRNKNRERNGLMEIKCSYTTFSVTEKNLEEAIDIAVQYGLDGIELRGRGQNHISPECTFSYVSAARERIRKNGLSVPCLTAYTKFRQETVQKVYSEADRLMDMVSLAEYLEAGCIRVFLGEIPEGMEKADSDAVVREGLFYVAEKLKDRKVRLAIETHDSGKSGRALAPLLEGVSRSVGVLLDVIHPWEEKESIEETWNCIGDRIIHVHIKDVSHFSSGKRTYCSIGTGKIPVSHTVNWLKDHGYGGFYSLEWEPSVGEDRGISFEDQLGSLVEFMNRMKGGKKDASNIL